MNLYKVFVFTLIVLSTNAIADIPLPWDPEPLIDFEADMPGRDSFPRSESAYDWQEIQGRVFLHRSQRYVRVDDAMGRLMTSRLSNYLVMKRWDTSTKYLQISVMRISAKNSRERRTLTMDISKGPEAIVEMVQQGLWVAEIEIVKNNPCDNALKEFKLFKQ